MNVGVVALLLVVFVVVRCSPVPQEIKMYTTKYDFVDVQLIIRNQRLFSKYVQCFLTDQKCTPHANELKRILPDALNTECAKCSRIQKEKVDKVFTFVYNNMKDVFDKLAERFDPRGEHRERYTRFAEQRGIKFHL